MSPAAVRARVRRFIAARLLGPLPDGLVLAAAAFELVLADGKAARLDHHSYLRVPLAVEVLKCASRSREWPFSSETGERCWPPDGYTRPGRDILVRWGHERALKPRLTSCCGRWALQARAGVGGKVHSRRARLKIVIRAVTYFARLLLEVRRTAIKPALKLLGGYLHQGVSPRKQDLAKVASWHRFEGIHHSPGASLLFLGICSRSQAKTSATAGWWLQSFLFGSQMLPLSYNHGGLSAASRLVRLVAISREVLVEPAAELIGKCFPATLSNAYLSFCGVRPQR